MWTNVSMARRLDFEKRRFDGKPTINIKEESEFRRGDFTSKWIAKAQSPERITVMALLEKHKEKLNHREIDFLTNLLDYRNGYSDKQKKWLTDIAGKANPQKESVPKRESRKSKWRGKKLVASKPITTPRRSKWKGKKLAPGEAPF